MSKVVVHRHALRYLQRLSRPNRERVRTSLVHLAEELDTYPGVVHMVGEWGGLPKNTYWGSKGDILV